MKVHIRALQIAVLQILDHAHKACEHGNVEGWSVQGFGMLRWYVRKIGRLHIWDSALRYPNVSMIHNHSWDLTSHVISGVVHNTRYEQRPCYESYFGRMYHGKRMITGYDCVDVQPLQDCPLLEIHPLEVYVPGETYSQKATELHRTDADNGTITLMERNEDANGQADIWWPFGTEWGTARPRPATVDEVLVTVTNATKKLEKAIG